MRRDGQSLIDRSVRPAILRRLFGKFRPDIGNTIIREKRPRIHATTLKDAYGKSSPLPLFADMQGLVRIAPAKQFRLQLHVTTNAGTERCGATNASELATDAARPLS